MSRALEIALTVFASVMASSGLWTYIASRHNKKDAKTRMILGLGHDRIVFLCLKYIERGWMTHDEYEDLNKYLYKPYVDMGGNGTAEKLMEMVRKLPIHSPTYPKQGSEHNATQAWY